MNERKWMHGEKLAIVLEGIKGQRLVAELCREHQISHALYYCWRDKFLEAGEKDLIFLGHYISELKIINLVKEVEKNYKNEMEN